MLAQKVERAAIQMQEELEPRMALRVALQEVVDLAAAVELAELVVYQMHELEELE